MKNIHPLEGILKPRDLLNPYIAAGVAGHIATNIETESRTAQVLDRVVGRLALGQLGPPAAEPPQAETKLWHGTGRYKYKDGKIIDILGSIADSGSILPSRDKFDLLRPMTSVSLARSRMYARAYADMFGNGSEETERYGSSLFWACAFLGGVAVEASKETRVWRPSGYHRMVEHLATANAIEWYKKVTRLPNPNVVGVYGGGSDIHHNYPVLFGVRDVEPAVVSRAVALHEVRTEAPVELSEAVTHVEVPRTRIDETRTLLGGLAIRAIEDSEAEASNYTFTQHIHAIL